MRERIYLNNGWLFTEQFEESLIGIDETALDMAAAGAEPSLPELKKVRIPHTCKELPFHYFDESEYQMLCGYVRKLYIPADWSGKCLKLTFEGAAHDAVVYVNGQEAAAHHCGYTAFTADISQLAEYGAENIITVRLDTRESLNVPPFGFVIDYMTYGGLYRDVYLDVCEPIHLDDIFLHADGDMLTAEVTCAGTSTFRELLPELTLRQYMRRAKTSGTTARSTSIFEPRLGDAETHTAEDPGASLDSIAEAAGTATSEFRLMAEIPASNSILKWHAGNVRKWSPAHPWLYEIRTELVLRGEEVLDSRTIRFGFRDAEFRKDGFYLNGRKLKIRGLNRHQSYPYVGYAMPDSIQKRDADILKYELGLNAVRTSHYPQSQAFLDRCDEIGLLVFTEFPGWQHIGDADWKAQALENLKDMILQYRNHTSIILWGVRINESVDDEEFYARTNSLAHALDPTRATGGVRCYKKGIFQEDVFTYNDFSHAGSNPGVEPKRAVTADISKPYLVSEYNGHMYPTKMFDSEDHRLQHALRHANVLDEVNAQRDIAGSFGWCMADYNTHKDFGSGDRICYHGVLDMFRNPKLAASIYASQRGNAGVLEITSMMDIGEHPAGTLGRVYAITNADSVRLYKNNEFIAEFTPEGSEWKHLKHPPILIDDYIGDQLETKEHMPKKQADAVKSLLNEAAKTGLYDMPKTLYAKALTIATRYRMKISDAVALYGRYVGNWGGEQAVYRFDAVQDGRVVKSVTRAPMTQISLKAHADRTELTEGKSYDAAAIRIRLTDEKGNVLPFANEPILFETEGPVELIGPAVISTQGGCTGTYVKTTGKAGDALLRIRMQNGITEEIRFHVTIEK